MPKNAPHMPSAAAVKIAYVQALADAYEPLGRESSALRRDLADEFDRFLAAHDAQVARNTLDALQADAMRAHNSGASPADPRSWAEMAGAVQWYRDTNFPEESPNA